MDAQATFSCSFTQSDLGPVAELPSLPPWPAQRLLSQERLGLAVQVLAGAQPVSDLAREHGVSRKFLYHQAHTAQDALTRAFAPEPKTEKVLFYLPVTNAWLRQLVLALVMIGHSPYRAVVELLRDVFDWRISLGTVHNIVASVVEPARVINRSCDLGGVRIGAHDEIFQAGHPVLVGVDTATTYCYLLSLEDHRDSETWGVRLLELADQGFAPDATVADAGLGLRAGQALALPEVPCRGDIFHVLRELEVLTGFLENRAYDALQHAERCRRNLATFRRHDGRGRAKSLLSATQLLHQACVSSAAAIALADEVTLLMSWLRHDVLPVAGPRYDERRDLYDFIVAELKSREQSCPHRIGPVCRHLEKQRDELLAFARALDEELEQLGQDFQIPAELARLVLGTINRDDRDPRRWTEHAAFQKQLRGRFHDVQAAVANLAAGTVRASSLVENLNSRLRSYFFLRRHLGPDYLALLQFFLNHRRLERSDRPERVGKTPAELMTGHSHPHWLEMLGYTRFRRA
jgi:hypothetical protein